MRETRKSEPEGPDEVPVEPWARRLRAAKKYREIELEHEISWSEIGRQCAEYGRAIDSTTISRIKQGQQEPSMSQMFAICAVLKYEPGWVAWGRGPMRAPAAGKVAEDGLRPMTTRTPPELDEEKPRKRGTS